jgi:hypothetical protein
MPTVKCCHTMATVLNGQAHFILAFELVRLARVRLSIGQSPLPPITNHISRLASLRSRRSRRYSCACAFLGRFGSGFGFSGYLIVLGQMIRQGWAFSFSDTSLRLEAIPPRLAKTVFNAP